MSETEPLPDPAMLAAELALGVLEGEDLAQARRRQIAEPEFAREVERWRDHFAVLAVQTPDRAPPAELAARVAAAVRDQQGGQVVALRRQRPRGRWRLMAWAGGGIAAALLFAVLWWPGLQPAAPVLVAALDVSATHQTLLASLDARGHVRVAGPVAVPPAHDAQLWLIVGKAPPRSLGLLHVAADQRLQTAEPIAAKLPSGSTLAISIEPVGGSPTGLPTGPVVASGVIQTI